MNYIFNRMCPHWAAPLISESMDGLDEVCTKLKDYQYTEVEIAQARKGIEIHGQFTLPMAGGNGKFQILPAEEWTKYK